MTQVKRTSRMLDNWHKLTADELEYNLTVAQMERELLKKQTDSGTKSNTTESMNKPHVEDWYKI